MHWYIVNVNQFTMKSILTKVLPKTVLWEKPCLCVLKISSLQTLLSPTKLLPTKVWSRKNPITAQSLQKSKLKYGWRGTHIFTPGTGHGRGCITLLPVHVQPRLDTLIQLGQRGHIFKVSINQGTAIIANIYSPTGHSREKIEFFEKVKREIEMIRDPADDVYLLGDFNTVFEKYETQFRAFTNQEQRFSQQIKQIIDSLALEDAWLQDRTTHTWRQPGSRKSSRLDRIYYLHNLKQKSIFFGTGTIKQLRPQTESKDLM